MSATPALRRPIVSVAVALVAGAAFFALSWFVLGHTWDVRELDQPLVVYNTPVGVLFVLWLLHVEWRATRRPQRALVALVIISAVLRSRIVHPLIHVDPPWSGHALIASFALVTARSIHVRIAAVLVLAQTVHLKVRFDDHSWTTGILVGVAAGAMFVALARYEPSKVT